MEFTAIDFETANSQPHSACQLGAVVVRDGQIVDRKSWLIRPRPLSFSTHNIRVHGITPADVREAADFGELWRSIEATLGCAVLVAHNARFDLGVLRACLNFYTLPTPDLQFTCTRAIAREAWPGQRGYGLRPLADRLGITFRHHDALEDADACAQVLLRAADEAGAGTLDELEEVLQLERGRAGDWGCGGPRRRKRKPARGGAGNFAGYRQPGGRGNASGLSGYGLSGHSNSELSGRNKHPVADPTWLRQLGVEVVQRQSFDGETVVFTGLLRQLDRGHAEWLVERGGGRVGTSVNKQTSIVVVGDPDARTLRAGREKSTKQERAEALQRQGQSLQLIGERSFLQRVTPQSSVAEPPTKELGNVQSAKKWKSGLAVTDREFVGGE